MTVNEPQTLNDRGEQQQDDSEPSNKHFIIMLCIAIVDVRIYSINSRRYCSQQLYRAG